MRLLRRVSGPGWVSRCSVGSALLAFLLIAVGATDALADCLPAVGTVVTCAPPGTKGYDSGAQTGINLTVLPNATVDTGVSPFAALMLTNNNIIANYGSISAVAGTAGIFVGDFNSIFNYGSIVAGVGGAGIFSGANNTVTNYGTIVTGDGGFGISVTDTSKIFNYGSVTATGFGSAAIQLGGNTSTFNNYGTARGLNGASSVEACACTNGNTINNYGTLDSM